MHFDRLELSASEASAIVAASTGVQGIGASLAVLPDLARSLRAASRRAPATTERFCRRPWAPRSAPGGVLGRCGCHNDSSHARAWCAAWRGTQTVIPARHRANIHAFPEHAGMNRLACTAFSAIMRAGRGNGPGAGRNFSRDLRVYRSDLVLSKAPTAPRSAGVMWRLGPIF